MADDDIVGRIMDKAETADQRALFAAVQAAVAVITDLYYGIPRPYGPDVDVFLGRVEEALDVGAPYGSPEHLAHLERLQDRFPVGEWAPSPSPRP